MDPDEEDNTDFTPGGTAPSSPSEAAPTATNPTGGLQDATAPSPASAPTPTTSPRPNSAKGRDTSAGGGPGHGDRVAEKYGFVDPERTADPHAVAAAQKALRDFESEASRNWSVGGYNSQADYMAERGANNRSDLNDPNSFYGGARNLATGDFTNNQGGRNWTGSGWEHAAPVGGYNFKAPPQAAAAANAGRVTQGEPSGIPGWRGTPRAASPEAGTGFMQANGSYGPRATAVQTDAFGNVIQPAGAPPPASHWASPRASAPETNTGFQQANGTYGPRSGAVQTDAFGNILGGPQTQAPAGPMPSAPLPMMPSALTPLNAFAPAGSPLPSPGTVFDPATGRYVPRGF